QQEYNERHGITPQSVVRGVQESLHQTLRAREVEENIVKVTEGGDLDVVDLIRELEEELRGAAAALEYERAALLRDQIRELKANAGLAAPAQVGAEKLARKKVSYRQGSGSAPKGRQSRPKR